MTNLKEILKAQEEEFDTRFPSRRSEIFNDSYLFDPDPRELKAWHNKAVFEAMDAILEEIREMINTKFDRDSKLAKDYQRKGNTQMQINHGAKVALANQLKNELGQIVTRYTTLKKEYQ